MTVPLDAFTERHLSAWADRVLFDDEREEVLTRIRALVGAEPDLLDRGWPSVRELVR
jgi:hypothetical protein